VVPGARARPGRPRARLLRLERHDERYEDARIIFVDTETSNWTWDPVRGQYYWHRFFSHQPDLNFDNPEVQEAMLDVLRFWLDLGIDGFRLDAVPYLSSARAPTARTCPRRTSSSSGAREVDADYPDRCCSPRPTSGRPTSSSTSATATSATWRSTSR
jgi:maltose alpha-D-glucosyltransferase/alpha-amylase